MSSLCFVCELPILSHQTWGNWPKHTEENGDEKPQVDLGTRGSTYHEDCLSCETCGFRLNGSNFNRARRYKDKIYCALHYADVSGLVSGDEFMQKLREFKRQSLGCAEARRKSSTTLQFPTPVQACPGEGACASYSHFIKPTPGYWIECSGSDGGSNTNPAKSSTGNVTIKVTKQQSDGGSGDTNSPFELMSLEEESYDKYFYATEHWNYFTNDEALGPVILSIKQENINNRDQFRVMLRTVSYRLNGLVPASCICADRYDREAVVRSLGDEAQLKPRLTLGQLPSTPDELLKLDQVFIKSELKVGIVYVKEGQSTEEHILDNTTHSQLFDEFLSILGDRVRLKGFDKYKGGLDTVHDLTGTESVYTSWRGIEIMFHVATLLPHEDHDPQKLQKKRHIGNDIVCVAFLEGDETLFSPACIKSHFLHTFIVVRTSPKKPLGVPTTYEVSVVSRDEVGAYKPYLWHRSKFEKDALFREWLLTKIVNGERASYSAPKFARMQDRTRSQMLEDIVANLQNHAETGQIPKPYRRGSWRPIGHMRPSSPLLDSVRDTFEGYEQLAKDFTKAFQSNHQLCDVIFNVGQGKDKTKVYAVRAILGIRSRVFLEMLYGFTAGYGLGPAAPMENISRVETPKSSNFLQVPDINEPSRNKAPSSPMVWRYFSRLGSWAGWGMGSRSSSKTQLASDPGGLKRWQSEFDCKDKSERKQSLAGTTVALSVCADAHKVDRVKLCQTEFNIIEFDSDTFRILIDYLQSGSCPLTCETVPGLICAAEHYDLPELLQACFHHAKQHLRIAVVCSMLNTLENYYWRYTSASELVNTILQHVDAKAAQLFQRREFLDLSESMFQMIVGRELGNIPEVKKFEVMLQWANHKVNNMGHPGTSSGTAKNENPTLNKEQLRKASINQLQLDRDYYPRELQCTMNRLTRDLKLHKIPPQDLIKVVLPTKTISNERILETLLFQADTGMYRIQPSYLDQCRIPDDDDDDDYSFEEKPQKLSKNSKR